MGRWAIPRGRLLSRKRSYDPKFNALTDSEALLYDLLVTWLDAEGRYFGDPFIVKGNVCPLRDWTVEQVDQMLDRIQEIKRDDGLGLLERYQAKGMSCLWCAGFASEQTHLKKDYEAKGKYGYSEIPPPPQRLVNMLGKSAKEGRSPPSKEKISILETPIVSDETISQMATYYETKVGKVAGANDAERLKHIAEHFSFNQFKDALDKPQSLKATNPIAYVERILESEQAEKNKPRNLGKGGLEVIGEEEDA